MKQFSKRLLVADYIITLLLLFVFVVCSIVLESFDFGTFGMIICAWIAQLGISAGAYYVVIKSEHRIELPIKLLSELPDDVKGQIDLTTIITTVLTSSDN